VLDLAVLPAFDDDDEDFADWNDPPAGPFPPPGPVTYPTSPLACRVELALGADVTQPWWTWVWEDITRFVRHADGITVTEGRQDELSEVQAGKGTLRLDNRDFRFSRRNPMGQYYGLLTKNTPIRASIDPGSGWVPRMEMFVTEWPSRADRSLSDVTVPITCAGILRRLGQGSVAKSALRRAILASSPALYYPLEDGTSASIAASGLPSGPPLTVVGDVDFASDNGPDGSLPLPGSLLDDAGYLTVTATVAATTAYVVEFALAVDTTLASGGSLVRWFSPGDPTLAQWNISYDGDGDALQVDTISSTGVETSRLGYFYVAGDVEFHHFIVTVAQSGTDAALALYVDGVLASSATVATSTVFAPRNPIITRDSIEAPSLGPASFGHLAFYGSAIDVTDHYRAMIGYVGELAHERIARLCSEEGITFTGSASTSPPMGPQGADSLLNLLQECAAVDLGLLYERGFGLGYQSHTERHNAAVALTMDFDQGHIASEPEHADDDQQIRNRWTINRVGGSGATIEDAASITANDLWDDSDDLNLETDAQCQQEASWRVHLGTVDEERWPRFDINFASTGGRTLIPSWLALPFGARANVLNPPDLYTPDAVDAFIEGREERWDPINWDVGIFTTPAAPYEVHVVAATGNRGRVDGNSTLAADATAGATTISVSSPGALWRTGAVSFDLEVAGERMTVTNIAGGSSPQTFTVTRAINGVAKAQPAVVGSVATRVRLWKPGVYAL
jgi:hypothetical protein